MIAGALVVLPQAFVMSTEYDDVRVSVVVPEAALLLTLPLTMIRLEGDWV